MALLGIISFLVFPVLVGAPISRIFISRKSREKKTGLLTCSAVGLLSLFAWFLFVFAIGLKLDVTLDGLEKLFFLSTAALGTFGLVFLIFDRKKFCIEKISSSLEFLWIGCAIVLAVVAIFFTIPTFATDDTFELVRTTIKVRVLYKNASLTGMISEAGVSGFVKVYICPMFLACMCDFFKIDIAVFAVSVFQPVLLILNFYLVRKIASYFTRLETSFMLVYIAVLIAGTVIPATSVPATSGFVLLRDGYTGYSVAYGVALCTVTLLLLQKNYFLGVVMLSPVLGLVRLDNIMECLKSPVETFHLINSAGRLAILYILAAVYCFAFHTQKPGKRSLPLLLSGAALISTAYVDILERIKEKKGRIVLTVGAILILLASAGFNTFEGAKLSLNTAHVDRNSANIARVLEKSFEGTGKIPVVWGPDEIITNIRSCSANVRLVYGKRELGAMITGTNYEIAPALIEDYKRYIKDISDGTLYYELQNSYGKTLESLYDLGVNSFVLPENGAFIVSITVNELEKMGFAKECVMGGYGIYIKK